MDATDQAHRGLAELAFDDLEKIALLAEQGRNQLQEGDTEAVDETRPNLERR